MILITLIIAVTQVFPVSLCLPVVFGVADLRYGYDDHLYDLTYSIV